ncbi:uncharacterized protein FA14DRAFT_64876 [Meira miltonrushii]|uniref:Uncharacterized protein n=1 Tax=Meira miltonrushii TaxID=1280837 RepID=A0A316V7X8_9BASI|nr:uncharacterized protein FA14DRAFT_64876 [Meira miltonrushii]PWN33717.1 hypothetical protein FA14DRAFT_64876 [Meira miltonrushii]
MEERQSWMVNGYSFISNLVKPPKLLPWLVIPSSPMTFKVEQLSEKVDQWGLSDRGSTEDENIYRDHQPMPNYSEMLGRFLACPIQPSDQYLSHYLQTMNIGRFSFITLVLPSMQSSAYCPDSSDLDEVKGTRSVTCAIDGEGHWITITVINNILLFRLEKLGFRILCKPTDIKAKVVYSILRNYKQKSKVLKQGSEFLNALTEMGCIVMHRDQAIYPWNSVQHDKLLKKVIELAYQQTKSANSCFLQPVCEPALSLMASKDVSALNRDMGKIIH